MSRKNFASRHTAFGESGAKRSQDDKPCKVARPVRTASVDYGLRSHLSLRCRHGREVSATWPLLSRLSSAPLIPARPFGLGWRFDEALLVAPTPFRMGSFAPAVDQPAKAEPRYHAKRLIARGPAIGYIMAPGISREEPPAVSLGTQEPRSAQKLLRGFRALRPCQANQLQNLGSLAA